MRGAVLLLAILAAGCGHKVPTTPVAMTDAYTDAVQVAVTDQLKDPESARFGPMQAARSVNSGTVRVCGTVNAKNSFGGYTGKAPYVVDIEDGGGSGSPVVKTAVVGSSRNTSDLSLVAGIACNVAGL